MIVSKWLIILVLIAPINFVSLQTAPNMHPLPICNIMYFNGLKGLHKVALKMN